MNLVNTIDLESYSEQSQLSSQNLLDAEKIPASNPDSALNNFKVFKNKLSQIKNNDLSFEALSGKFQKLSTFDLKHDKIDYFEMSNV